jgi:hypothetical protein
VTSADPIERPVEANGVPTSNCPADQGGPFLPYTDGYSGTALGLVLLAFGSSWPVVAVMVRNGLEYDLAVTVP